MCGIAGIFDLKKSSAARASVEEMVRCLEHRGPDDRDVMVCDVNGRVCLGHTRLAILDLSASGHQPMLDKTRTLSLTYNGECYNYLNLRHELSESSEDWHSETDTEVVLRAYEKWGVAAFNRLRGMFALALWDDRRRALVLARDPFGIKPLYYYRTNNKFIFASELKSLLASELVPRRISRTGLASYLQTGSVAAPETIIEGIRLLLPGHYMFVEASDEETLDVKEIAYTEESTGSFAPVLVLDRREAVELLREELKESVRIHLASDVPLGIFLSGGIDSSALVALMSQVAGDKAKTFSVVFSEKKFSEASHAARIAELFKTEHHEIHLAEHQLLELLPTALGAEDQPTMDGVNTFVVSKAVKDAGITVALSGLGGDELFAGYPTFKRAVRLQSVARIPGSLRRGVSSFGGRVWNSSVQQKKLWQSLASDCYPVTTYSISRQLFSFNEAKTFLADGADLNNSSIVNPASADHGWDWSDPINAVSICELRGYMANTLLRDTDCMSMAHSLEVRVPFVDVAVVRLVMGLPGKWKIDGGRPKPLLQDAMSDLLPPEIMNRPKMGFTLPFEKWMQSRLRGGLEEAFANGHKFKSIGLRPNAVRDVWHRFLCAPQKIGWSRPWALYVLGRWCEQHQVTL